jgi:hypothetical protein
VDETTGTETTTETQTTEAPAADVVVETTDDSTILGGETATEGTETTEGEAAAETAVEGPPEKYELAASEGATLDPETLAEAEPVFRELGLSNDGAQKLIPLAERFAERIAAQSSQAANQVILNEVVAQRKEWAAEARNDPEIGGNNWSQTEELSAKALDALGYPKGSPFRSFLTDSGLGNHPEMIRAFRKVGELVGEDNDFVRGDAAASIKSDRLSALYPNDVPKSEGAS